MPKTCLFLSLSLLVTGCDGRSPSLDGGSPSLDGGSPGLDGGSPSLDGGSPDAGSFDVELTDDPSPVTDAAGDSLLRLSIVDAPEPLALTAVEIWLSPPGGTTSVMPFAHEDNDSDGMLSAGDVFIVQEPPANIVGTAEIGTTYSVSLLEDIGPMRVTTLWEGTWTAL